MVRQEAVNSLLAEIRNRIERLSAAQHRMARDHRILTDAATQLRPGKSAEAVLAEIKRAEPGPTSGFLRPAAHNCSGASAIDWSRRGIGVKVGGVESESRGDGGLAELVDCSLSGGAAVQHPTPTPP
jgi:hypothetical protein